MPHLRLRALLAASTTAVAALALVVAPAAPALAAGATGWVRVAHLSPDTKSVDVRLAPLDGGADVIAVDDVSYGTVSKYLSLPVGDYAVAMRPAGSSASSSPVVQTSVAVRAGGASTVAVFGTNAELQTRVIPDALTLPKAGTARVRVVQASTAGPVTVTTGPGRSIVADAALATVSPYADVAAGRWTLTAAQGGTTADTAIDLKAGQIASVFVLDDADGGIVLRRVLDSASVGGVPKGYLATGGGYLAHEAEQERGLALAGTLAALLGVAGLTAAIARRRARARA